MGLGEIIGISIVFMVGINSWSGIGFKFIYSIGLSLLVIFGMLFFFKKTKFGSFVYREGFNGEAT